MSHEGFVLAIRVAVVLSLIFIGALIRTFIGPSRQRGLIMGAGTLGGLAAGVMLGYLLPSSLKMRESAILAVWCLLLGESVAWFFARKFPRESHEPIARARTLKAPRT